MSWYYSIISNKGKMILECIHPGELSFSKRKAPRQFKVGDKLDVDDQVGAKLIKSGKWKNTNETITPEDARAYAELEDSDPEPRKRKRK